MKKDYLGMIKVRRNDKLDYGVRGMRWGIRKSSAQLRAEAAQRGDSKPKAKAPEEKNSTPQGGVESSAARYARLKSEAKTGSATGWTETDLKFFNARTDALAKVAKMNEQKPGWLQETTKRVLQQSAQRQMQSIADGLADKYVSGPVLQSLKDNSAAIKAESKTPVDYVGRRRAKKKN